VGRAKLPGGLRGGLLRGRGGGKSGRGRGHVVLAAPRAGGGLSEGVGVGFGGERVGVGVDT